MRDLVCLLRSFLWTCRFRFAEACGLFEIAGFRRDSFGLLRESWEGETVQTRGKYQSVLSFPSRFAINLLIPAISLSGSVKAGEHLLPEQTYAASSTG